MTTTSHEDTVDDTSAGASLALRRALIALCVTEIISWGVLYYAFPVLLGSIVADTGWSYVAVMGAFSIGLAVSAVAGIPVGRLLDRFGPRPVMTLGSVLGALSLGAIALAPGIWWFIAAWAVSGIAQACVFYKPAFAAITGWYGAGRVKALTVITLVGGLASTVFAPVAAELVQRTDWRTTYLILGVFLGVVTIPVHALFLSPPWHRQDSGGGTQVTTKSMYGVLRSPAFIILTVMMMLASFALFVATLNLVPLLTAMGASTTFAAWALGLSGAGQLLGRIGYARLVAVSTVRARTVGILISAAVAIVLTTATAGPSTVLIVVAIVFGATRGIFTLLEATAVSDRWGTAGFGTLFGIYSAPSTIAMATTPFAGAVLTGWMGSYQAVFALAAGIMFLAGVGAIWSVPRHLAGRSAGPQVRPG